MSKIKRIGILKRVDIIIIPELKLLKLIIIKLLKKKIRETSNKFGTKIRRI